LALLVEQLAIQFKISIVFLHGEGKFGAELRQQLQKSIYTTDEVQKLLERCFSF
jgi:hypothetical protein